MANLQIKSLGERIRQLAQTKSGKSKIGYGVDGYSDVMDALQKAKWQRLGANTEVLGVTRSYEDLQGMQFDANGFSMNPNDAIWRMQLGQWGNVVVQTSDGKYQIGVSERERLEKNNSAVKHPLPPNFPIVGGSSSVSTAAYTIGAKLDVSNLGVAYFNQMFCSRGQDDQKITEPQFGALVASGYLCAEVIFPTKNVAYITSVVGTTQISNHSTIYINRFCVGSPQWKDSGLRVTADYGDDKGVQLAPNGSTLKLVSNGCSYDYNSSTIKIDGSAINDGKMLQWKKDAAPLTNPPVVLVQQPLTTAFIRLFVPTQHKGKVKNFLPQSHSQNLYATYGSSITDAYVQQRQRGGIAQMMIINAMKEWEHAKYNEFDSNGNRVRDSLRYVFGGGHSAWKYQGENGSVQFRKRGASSGQRIAPLFVSSNSGENIHNYDCSSFVAMVIYDSGMFRQNLSPPSFASGSLKSSVNKFKQVLKPQYDCQYISIKDYKTDMQAGDVIFYERGQSGRSTGHVALVWSVDKSTGKIRTLEIQTKNARNKNVLRQRTIKQASMFNHIIRFYQSGQ